MRFMIGTRRRLRIALVLVLGNLVFSPAAHAGWFSNLVTTVVSTTLGLPSPSNPVFSTVTATLGLLTGCSTTTVDGIQAQCFDSNQLSKLNQAVAILKARQYRVNRNGTVDPYSSFRDHTQYLINWDNALVKITYLVGHLDGCNSNTAWACHVVDGTTFFTGGGLSQDPIIIAGVLSHEGDHYNKMHDCGDTADQDANGPYGLEAIYQMSTYWNPPANVTSGQVSLGYSRALNIANYQLCGNATARDQVLNYKNSSSLYVSSSSSSTGSSGKGCKTCMIP